MNLTLGVLVFWIPLKGSGDIAPTCGSEGVESYKVGLEHRLSYVLIIDRWLQF